MFPFKSRAEDDDPLTEQLPAVVWITFADQIESPQLLNAVEAQLSGSPVVFSHVKLKAIERHNENLKLFLSQISKKLGASMLFWAVNDSQCSIFYYLPDLSESSDLSEVNGGRIIESRLSIESRSLSSRQEFIAISASGMVERLLATKKIKPVHVTASIKPEPVPKPVEPLPPVKRTLGEVVLSYETVLLSKDTWSNGGKLGIALFPSRHLVAGLGYIQFFPVKIENRDLGLSIISKIITVYAAARFITQKTDLRLGVSWDLDIRSFDTTLRTDNLQQSVSDKNMVHSILPFISAGYNLNRRFGIYLRSGVGIGLNETNYKYKVDEESYFAKKIYGFKFNFSAGIKIYI